MDIFDELRRVMSNALGDLNILAGDDAAGTDVGSWRDVAGTAACNLRELAALLDAIRTDAPWKGCKLTGPTVFPSPIIEALAAREGGPVGEPGEGGR